MSDKNKRNLLKALMVGGTGLVAGKALPDRWIKPVINSIAIPAHAQTTCEATSITATVTAGNSGNSIAVAIWDDGPTNLANDVGTGSASTNISGLSAGGYIVSAGVEGADSVTLVVETECSSLTVVQSISGGDASGGGTGMMGVE